jgi:hypothetical protein
VTWCKYVSDELLVAIKNEHLIGLFATKWHKAGICYKKAQKSQKEEIQKTKEPDGG